MSDIGYINEADHELKFIHQTKKLGLKRPLPSQQKRIVRLSEFIDPSLYKYPTSSSRRKLVSSWGMDKNDTIGDCGPAAVDHTLDLMSAVSGKPPAGMTEQQVIDFYSQCSGYDPKTGAHDDGVVMVDMLNLWQNKGLPTGNKIVAYAAVDFRNEPLLRWALDNFVAVIEGTGMPLAWQGQRILKGPTSKVPTSGPWAPYSWGGHACLWSDQDKDGVWVCQWNDPEYYLTNQGKNDYCVEAYVLVDESMVGNDGRVPNGFDMAGLLDAVAIAQGKKPPKPVTPPPVNPPVTPNSYTIPIPAGMKSITINFS